MNAAKHDRELHADALPRLMPLYEVSVAGGAGTISVAQAELRAAATDTIYVYEIGVSLTAATASSIGYRATGEHACAGGTLTLGQANVQDDAAQSVVS
jgi:hypothetical protein